MERPDNFWTLQVLMGFKKVIWANGLMPNHNSIAGFITCLVVGIVCLLCDFLEHLNVAKELSGLAG